MSAWIISLRAYMLSYCAFILSYRAWIKYSPYYVKIAGTVYKHYHFKNSCKIYTYAGHLKSIVSHLLWHGAWVSVVLSNWLPLLISFGTSKRYRSPYILGGSYTFNPLSKQVMIRNQKNGIVVNWKVITITEYIKREYG